MMRKIIRRTLALILTCAILLVGCGKNVQTNNSSTARIEFDNVNEDGAENVANIEGKDYSVALADDDYLWDENYDYDEYDQVRYEADPSYLDTPILLENTLGEYEGLADEALLNCVENSIYYELVNSIDSDEYFIEGVEAVYISKEYLDELEYNSRTNIFFGYTLEELEAQFQGTKYVFTVGEDGKTTVVPFEPYDDTFEKVLRNVAIGTGVILVCVTVSVVTGGAGAPAVSAIFAASAKTGTVMALSSGALGAVASGTITGIETGDFDEAMKAAALAGSEGFMWGAVSGACVGGISETIALNGMTQSGLTMNEAALIQKESGLPAELISEIKSMEEYNIYKEAGLKTAMIDGKLALIRDLNLEFKTQLADGRIVTNLERMKLGLAPIDPKTGLAYQLHHVNQNAEGVLAILTQAEHQGNAGILNTLGKTGIDHGPAWNKQRRDFWKAFAEAIKGI